MLEILMHEYHGEADFGSLAELMSICNSVDHLGEQFSVTELRESYNALNVDRIRQNIRLWKNTDGRLIGYSQVSITEPSEFIDGVLYYFIHPEVRGSVLETQMIAWTEQRLQVVSMEDGFPVKLRCYIGERDRYRGQMLSRQGCKIDRYFFSLELDLSQQIQSVNMPDQFFIRCVNGAIEAEKIVNLYNAAFIDAWNFHPLTIEDLEKRYTRKNYQSDFDLVVFSPNGDIVGWCVANVSPERNVRTGRNEGWIELLMIKRSFRKMGLGRAVLLKMLHQLQVSGKPVAGISVDADNPSDAMHFYESVGFSRFATFVSYCKDV